MAEYEVAIIGTGPGPDQEVEADELPYPSTEPSPSSMGWTHARAFRNVDNCRLVACADLVEEYARRFVEEFGLDVASAYTDHNEMLASEEPDVVSICTPATVRPQITIDCARAGGVQAIHGEKPMGWPWEDCRLMVQECERRNVQLTIGHQQRFSNTARRAKELIDAGEIGELERIEISRVNLFDAATHQIDLANYFTGDLSANWVMGQIDYREEYLHKGIHHENEAFGLWEYPNDVHGLITVGTGDKIIPEQSNVVIGTEGVIERAHGDGLYIKRHGETGREFIEQEGDSRIASIEHVVESLERGTEPLLSGYRALNGAEIIYGIRESARRRGRVEFPLTIEDDPLTSLVESGELQPRRPE